MSKTNTTLAARIQIKHDSPCSPWPPTVKICVWFEDLHFLSMRRRRTLVTHSASSSADLNDDSTWEPSTPSGLDAFSLLSKGFFFFFRLKGSRKLRRPFVLFTRIHFPEPKCQNRMVREQKNSQNLCNSSAAADWRSNKASLSPVRLNYIRIARP